MFSTASGANEALAQWGNGSKSDLAKVVRNLTKDPTFIRQTIRGIAEETTQHLSEEVIGGLLSKIADEIEADTPQAPAVPTPATPQRPATPDPRTPKSRELTPAEKAEAEKLWKAVEREKKFINAGLFVEIAKNRLVDNCRQIVRKFPGSEYAAKAKQTLKDLPQKDRQRFGVTDQEIK